jgi:uncharacterized damage-inducible protein DinB
MIRDTLKVLLLRELRALDREIAAYPDDDSVWLTAPGIGNSAGALSQHLCGNLRHFIGATLGSSGYKRDRDAEFSTRDRSRADLRRDVQSTIAELDAALDKVTPEILEAVYPLPLPDKYRRTGDFLMHLAVHLSYHLGQIDYHRRLLTTSSQSADTVSIRELPEFPAPGESARS